MSRIILSQHCVLCNKIQPFRTREDAALLRESNCHSCGVSIRQHSIFLGLGKAEGLEIPFSINQLKDTLSARGRKVYNTVSSGKTHAFLRDLPGYTFSEYLPNVTPGESQDGVLCQDLEKLTFPNSSFDYVISEDVFEHIATWRNAAKEILRVLRPGGSHIFTIPVMSHHATVDRTVKFPKLPVYHGDSLRDAIIVYTDFGSDIKTLWEDLGYQSLTTTNNINLTSDYSLTETYVDTHEEWARYDAYREKNDYLPYFCYDTCVYLASKKGTRMEFTGERMIPEHNTGGTIYLEHITRYQFASQIATDKDILDIACGSGYGSYELATAGAKSVVGVDISAETIAYANDHYTYQSLQFKEGSATAIPLPDASVDLVVSFETIEHIDAEAQIKFISEIKRVLRPNGVLIMSTPNVAVFPPGNEFHVKELTRGEYLELLGVQFKNTKLYSQDSVETSFITDESLHIDTTKIEINKDNCVYFVSVSSNAELPTMQLHMNVSSRQFWQEYVNLHNHIRHQTEEYRKYRVGVESSIAGKVARIMTYLGGVDQQVLAIYKKHGLKGSLVCAWKYVRYGRKNFEK